MVNRKSCNDWSLADLARQGGKTDRGMKPMTITGHPKPRAAFAATNLFTVGAAAATWQPTAPPMNNFGHLYRVVGFPVLHPIYTWMTSSVA